MAKKLALTSHILLGGNFAGSKAMQGWNPLFAKNKVTFIVSNFILLLTNSNGSGKSEELSCKKLTLAWRYYSITLLSYLVWPIVSR